MSLADKARLDPISIRKHPTNFHLLLWFWTFSARFLFEASDRLLFVNTALSNQRRCWCRCQWISGRSIFWISRYLAMSRSGAKKAVGTLALWVFVDRTGMNWQMSKLTHSPLNNAINIRNPTILTPALKEVTNPIQRCTDGHRKNWCCFVQRASIPLGYGGALVFVKWLLSSQRLRYRHNLQECRNEKYYL